MSVTSQEEIAAVSVSPSERIGGAFFRSWMKIALQRHKIRYAGMLKVSQIYKTRHSWISVVEADCSAWPRGISARAYIPSITIPNL